MGLSDDINEHRNIKEKSLKAYMIALKRIYREVTDDTDYSSNLFNNVGFLKKKYFKKVLSFLETLKLPTRKNYMAAVLVALTAKNDNDDQALKELIIEYRNNLDLIANEYNDLIASKHKSSKLQSNWTSMNELKKIVARHKRSIKEKGLVTKTDFNNSDLELYQKYLAGSLYTLLPPVRNDYADMKIITFKEYNKLENKKSNYLVIAGKTKKFFSFGAYKTSDVYGVKIVQIPSILNKIINKWLEHNKTGFFLINKQKKALSDNGLTKLLNKTFEDTNKNIGSTIIRHIYLSEKYKDVNDEKKKDSDMMMHSLSQQSDYVKN